MTINNIEIKEDKINLLTEQEIIGTITYHDTDEEISFFDKDKYLNNIKEAFNEYGINGWKFNTITNNPQIRKAVADIEYGEYGEYNPHDLAWYEQKYNKENLEDVVKEWQKMTNDKIREIENITLNAKGKTRKEFVTEIQDFFSSEIEKVYTSDRWIEYLNFISSLYDYSPRNKMLIYLQMPTARHIASMKDWNTKYNRFVIKGQGAKGIKILCPATKRYDVEKIDKNGNLIKNEKGEIETEKKEKLYFIPVSVYDISQTQGDPVPTIANELKGKVNGSSEILQAIEKLTNIPFQYSNDTKGAKGYFAEDKKTGEKEIVIKEGMSDEQTIKTALHETAHAILHSGENYELYNSVTKELQAESIAYLVCKNLGIDTGSYSFDYLASWSCADKEKKILTENINIICDTADKLNDEINYQLKRFNYSMCENPVACEKFVRNSENLTYADKQTYNKLVQEVDKLSADKIFVEISFSESPIVDKKLYSFKEFNDSWNNMDIETRNNYIEQGYKGCYDKTYMVIYYEYNNNGVIEYNTITERMDLGDLSYKNITDFIEKTQKNEVIQEIKPLIENIEKQQIKTKTR